MRKTIYIIIAFVGFMIRQFWLPNPFAPFGTYAELINLIVSGFLAIISYATVGTVYERNSIPFLGSILYLMVYCIYSAELWIAFRFYPNIFWVIIVLMLMIIGDALVIKMIRKNI